jgi:hypothetical protein
VSVGGTVGGLLALIVAVTLVIVIRRNRMRSEAIEQEGESGDIDMAETIASFEASDQCVSQVRTEELIRLSFVIE